jgi:hypothetical protein
MIDISGRAVRAGIRSVTAVAAASCVAIMPQVTNNASAHTGGKATRAHDRTTPHRDHGDREGRDHDHGRADLVVDTKGPRGTIVPGRTYKWPFEVTNRGSVPAKDVSLTATPDRSLKVLAAPPKCRWRHTGPLVCKIGLLPQGKTRHGTITATVVPRARGRSLSNPVQVSWQSAPKSERARGQRLMAAFPPVDVSPGTEGTVPQDEVGKIPYPLMVTEHGPVTAESVVVRSPIGIPAPDGPCANGILPARIAGKSAPIKPALGPCGAHQDDPAACGCGARHDAPAADRPAGDVAPYRPSGDGAYVPDKPAAAPDRPAVTVDRPAGAAADKPAADKPAADKPVVDRPAADKPVVGGPVAAPCGAVATRPVVIPDRPIVPPCAHGRPGSVPSSVTDKTADDQPIATPCGMTPPRPAAVPDGPIVPPCAQGRPDAPSSPVGADRPVTVPCGASRPVILPARVPDAPSMPPCAGVQGRPGAEQAKPAADKPAQGTDKPAAKPDKPAGKPGTAADKPGITADKPADTPGAVADRPVAAAPCGAAAARPVEVPGQPVIVPNMPAIPPCAQGRPGACGCLNAQHPAEAPAAVPAAPVTPAAPVGPVVPGSQGVAPCAAEDKPMADGKAAAARPLAPSCQHDAPAAVHQEPGVTPDTVAPMTPLMSPGKSAHPLGRPHHHFPRSSGLAHRDCVRQGAGFVCPLGSAPHRRPHALNLGAPAHPHRLNCVGAEAAGCHTRAARPVAVRPQPVRRQLPVTGGSSELLALSGLGLAGAGVLLFGLSRARRRQGEEA